MIKRKTFQNLNSALEERIQAGYKIIENPSNVVVVEGRKLDNSERALWSVWLGEVEIIEEKQKITPTEIYMYSKVRPLKKPCIISNDSPDPFIAIWN